MLKAYLLARYSRMSEDVLTTKAKRSETFRHWTIGVVWAVPATIALTMVLAKYPTTLFIFWAFLMSVLLGLLLYRSVAIHRDWLAPLNDGQYGNQCAHALFLVEQSPAARAWRDAAVANGRVLRGFDVEEMERLTAKAAVAAAVAQREVDCKKLHGLPAA